MTKRGRPRREPEIVDNLYCTIDGWQRTFRFGVNRFPRFEGIFEKDGGIDEWDHLEVFGTVRYHYTTRQTRKRTGQKVVLWVFPGRFSRDDYKHDPQSVGGVWTEEGKLLGMLNIPSDAFYSLFPCLTAGTFKELEIKARNMRYRRGDLNGIEFAPKETPLEDLEG